MPAEHGAQRPSALAQDRAPRRRPRRDGQLLEDRLEDTVEDGRFIRDVVVQRHRLDAERIADAAHRDRVEALAIDDRERGLQDPFARQLHESHTYTINLRRKAIPLDFPAPRLTM